MTALKAQAQGSYGEKQPAYNIESHLRSSPITLLSDVTRSTAEPWDRAEENEHVRHKVRRQEEEELLNVCG